jgi:hypothetical protein
VIDVTTSSSKTSSKTKRVGDTHELKGHGIVVFPDGSAATASRSLVLTQEGKYKVLYNADEHRDESFTVNPKVTGDKG